jgi:ribosomal protein S18 acetylase RimI-like enzyme
MSAPEPITKQKLSVILTDVTKNNINQMKLLHKATLPVPYTEKYYQDTASNWPRENPWCRLGYHNEYLVGAVNARIETYNPEEPTKRVTFLLPTEDMPNLKQRKSKPPKDSNGNLLRYRVNITTLSVLPAYQNSLIGTTLLQDILQTADSLHLEIDSIYVHVHINNEKAMKFYSKFGFENIGTIEGYYQNDVISPPDCVILSRKTQQPPVVKQTATTPEDTTK